MISLIKKFILPKEIDFLSNLEEYSKTIEDTTDNLYLCFIAGKKENCQKIIDNEKNIQSVRKKNMSELLNTFLTPIDKESIYRIITELNWIEMSIRHFVIMAQGYELHSFEDGYKNIIVAIQNQSHSLHKGFINLKKHNNLSVAKNAQDVRNYYEDIINLSVAQMVQVANNDTPKEMFIHRDILEQLKEISKRMQLSADLLEDSIAKM